MGRALAADAFCDACEAEFHRRGSIGQCDHDFPGRPLRWWWANIRPPLPGRPVGDRRCHIGVAHSSTGAGARELLQPPPRHPVMELDDPAVMNLVRELGQPEAVVLLEIDVPLPWTHRYRSPYRS